MARGQLPGNLDLDFIPDTASGDILWALDLQPDGKIISAGREGSTAGVIYRFNTNGAADSTFQSGLRASADTAIPQINAVAIQTNGNIILGGLFTYIDAPLRLRLAELDSFGNLDPNFTPSASDTVFALVRQPDGKIIALRQLLEFQRRR